MPSCEGTASTAANERSMSQPEIDSLSLADAFSKVYSVIGAGSLEDAFASLSSHADDFARLLNHCQSLIDRTALFSSNEDQDDILTVHLKYLLVPFLQAEMLITHTQLGVSPSHRIQQLQEALLLYSAFLQRCDQYALLKGVCQDVYMSEEQGRTVDPGTLRNYKIERFKRSKAVRGLVQHLTSMRRAATEEAGTEAGTSGGWDEEDERQLWVLQLEAAALKALDGRPLIRQEMQLLLHAEKQKHLQQSSNQPNQQQGQQPAEDPGGQPSGQLQRQMMSRLADIAGQLSLSSDRQVLRQQVFRPTHILPSLTVEQQGEIELRDMREREARHRAAEADRAVAKAAQHSDDLEDEHELARQRAWDDFKDENPRGWGNSKLRPCA